MFNKAAGLLLFFGFVVMGAQAQNLSKSPYSALGIGELQFGGSAAQSALGQTVQGFRRTAEINNQNPASYGNLKFSVIEAGIRYSEGNISNSSGSSHIRNYSYGYLSVGVPLSERLRWGLSFGLQPVSSIGYNVASQVDFGAFPATLQSTGRGGLSKFYIGSGIDIFKNLAVGANISYIWGQLTSTKSTYIPPEYNKYNFEETRNTYIGDLYFDYGLQYHETLKEKYKLVVGLTVNTQTDIYASQVYTARTMGVGGITTTKDTVVYEGNKKGHYTLPLMSKLGFSLEEADHWMVCADLNYANWSSFRSFGASDSLKNMTGVSVGASFIPKSTDYKNYLKRIEYRIGGRYDNGYLDVYGKNIATFGLSAGIGLPLGRSKSRVNLSAEYYTRGTTENRLIREDYWRIVLGVAFSDKWFIRYKYD